MYEIKIKVRCPHCHSVKVVKDGKKAKGNQNFKCKCCKKQFQFEYKYRGADPCVKNLKIKTYYFDNWKRFKQVFAKENSVMGKSGTQPIEGVNTSFRVRNRRLVRRTTCFSKKMEYHEAAFAIMVQQRNYAHHTF
ncbi:MAG: hypothetical protein OHK0045_19630 [Raineya sp.]